jgi:RES domain-containing protein
VIRFAGQVWRIIWQGQDALSTARAPEGRFHHPGQTAVYTSVTEQGCATAIARYLASGDGPREIARLEIEAEQISDLRHEPAARMVWQDLRATGADAPTWAFSDNARRVGAQGMLYASRSRPDLSHLVIFDPRIILRETARKAWP